MKINVGVCAVHYYLNISNSVFPEHFVHVLNGGFGSAESYKGN